MAGEQEEVVRYSISGGMKFAKHISQLINEIKANQEAEWNALGGEVELEYLNQDGYTLNSIDITHVEDFAEFDKFARENGIQFAITDDHKNPEIEHLWFKASNQNAINQFLQDVFDYDNDIDIDTDKIITPEDLIKQKKEEQEYSTEVKYKLHEQDYEKHEYRIQSFQTFDDMKIHLSENYDSLLSDSNLDIQSFNEIHSIKQLEKVLSKLDSPKINLKLERKPLLEKFAEKVKEVNTKAQEKTINKIKNKIPELDGR